MESKNKKISPFMQRAIDISMIAGINVRSNPQVGCVITQNNRIIGEGFHHYYGQEHAEVKAYAHAAKNGLKPGQPHEVFVTLEPCGHTGKTPPCANLLANYKPKKVYILEPDSHPITANKGLKILENVQIPFCVEQERFAGSIHKRFYKNSFKLKPYVILKWAQDLNGNMGNNLKPIKISNSYTSRLVHKWRSEIDGILVGGETLRIDNPKLDNRFFFGRAPKKFILSNQLTPSNFNQFSFFTAKDPGILITQNSSKNTQTLVVDTSSWDLILRKLYSDFGISNLLIEGGSQILNQVINQSEWDEIRVITSSILHQNLNIEAPKLPNMAKMYKSMSLLNDQIIYYNI